MIFSPLLWVFVVTFLVGWYLLTGKKEGRRKGLKQIPGPMAFPLVGNALQLGKTQYLKYNEWSKKYGDIYKFKLGSVTNIVISNPKWMKEIFFDSALVGRPHFDGFELYTNTPEKLGLINSEGELWEVHRRFVLRQLRDFGFGKSAMENLILEEANETIANFKKLEGKPITDMKSVLTISVINSLWTVVSQKRFKHDDPKLLKLVHNTDKALIDLLESGGLAAFIFMPFLAKVIPEWSGYNKVRRVFAVIASWFEEQVDEQKSTFQEDNIRDFIDCYLAEMKKPDADPTFCCEMGERQLISTLFDIFFAGSDTTSTTLAWAILYLCKFPEMQRKLQDEISAITNNSRNVCTADMSNMPYTMALIDEVFRYSSIVPNGLQHRALEGKEFQGYFIPKDAWVQPNLHYLHHNPAIWGDPENFRPERFLSDDGKKYYVKSENLIPFQIGRRQCPGEILARQSVYIFLTNIFQRFEIKFDPNQPEPSLEPKATLMLYPHPYSVIMKDRQK